MLRSLALPVSLLLAQVHAQYSTGNGTSANGTQPLYKNANASIEARVEDLLSRMTIEEKTSQLLQGDIRNWLNITDGSFNETGLEWSTQYRGGSYYVGVPISWELLSGNIKIGQEYSMENTRLGIPPWVQSEGIHGFLIPNGTIFNSPIAYACSFNPDLVEKMAAAIAQESLALGVNNIFAPLADLARELRFGRVEETFGEDPHL
jgi:beta-glucosidase